jgi:hypothetical protein
VPFTDPDVVKTGVQSPTTSSMDAGAFGATGDAGLGEAPQPAMATSETVRIARQITRDGIITSQSDAMESVATTRPV